jgi:hypothetical protein
LHRNKCICCIGKIHPLEPDNARKIYPIEAYITQIEREALYRYNPSITYMHCTGNIRSSETDMY